MDFWKVKDFFVWIIGLDESKDKVDNSKEIHVDLTVVIEEIFSKVDWLIYEKRAPDRFLDPDSCTWTKENFDELVNNLENEWFRLDIKWSLSDPKDLHYTVAQTVSDSKKSVTKFFRTFKYIEK